MCMIGNPNETYYRYLARSRSGRPQRVGVPEREPKREDGEVRCIPRCEGREGAGGTRKALEGIAALALVLFLLIPGVAYASVASEQYGEPVYGPVTYDWQGETWTSVAYIAANKFDAAAYACGYSKSEIGQWDLTVRAKLSNESTAPDFYELASGFYAPVADDFVYTDQGPAPGFWGWAYSIYGEGNIWYHDGYTDTQVNAAKSEIEAILSGGSGGGSGGEVEGDLTVSGVQYKIFDTVNVPAGLQQLTRQSAGVAVSVAYLNAISAYLGENDISGAHLFIGVNDNPSWPSVSVAAVGVCPEFGTFEDVTSYKWLKWPDFPALSGVNLNAVSSVGYANQGMYVPSTTVDGKKYWLMNPAISKATVINGNANVWDGARPCYSYYYGDFEGNGGGGSDDPPENNWPDPDTPTVPDPPNHDAPTGGGDYVAPTLPKPTSPTQPTNVTVTVVTPVDDILDALNKIIEELENHCVHLQNKMVECSKYLGALEEQTRDAVIDAINENMSNSVALHDDLMSYLQELFQWMKDNMNYNVEVTNTNNNDDVIDWLKRIYIQDGTGYSNTKPIDITQDYNGFAVWVDGVIDNLLPDLTDTNLAPVTSAFDALDDKFPFSVPGDVLRIFQSLDRSPVTPVVSFTIPAMLGISSYTYSFDLSPYNGTMETIRTIELMAFVVFLLVWARRAFNAEAGGASD